MPTSILIFDVACCLSGYLHYIWLKTLTGDSTVVWRILWSVGSYDDTTQ